MLQRYNILERRLVDATEGTALLTVYANPDDAELKALITQHGIDAHTLRSALDPHEVPRAELAPAYAAAIIKRPKSYTAAANMSFQVSTAGVFLVRDRLVIVLPDEAPLVDTAEQLKEQGAAALFVHVLERLVTHFREHLTMIALILDELEESLFGGGDAERLRHSYVLGKSLVHYVAGLAANAGLFAALERDAEGFGLSDADRAHLADVAIENRQCQQQAELYATLLERLVAAHAAMARQTASVRLGTLTRALLATVVPLLVLVVYCAAELKGGTPGLWVALGVAAVGTLGVLGLVRPSG